MKFGFILSQLLLLASLASAQGPEKVMDCHFNQVPFSLFCSEVYRETGVKIYYREEWVDTIHVTLDNNSIAVLRAVKLAISGSGLEVSEWNNNLVLLPGVKLLAQLPPFEIKSIPIEAEEQKEKTLTTNEERYFTGRKADIIQTIHIGRNGESLSGAKAKVLCRVLDKETGEPIFGATSYLEETKSGAVTDMNGFFSLLLKPGKYNAQFEVLGFRKQKFILEVLSDGDFTVNMQKAVIQMQEFVVHGDRQMSINSKDPGLDKLSMKVLKELPMMMGERDILKISGTLPGIVSIGEGSAGLNVRGGGSDQNAFYINKIPIYNTSHLFGFFPVFNADIIKDFSIYKGYIPAQYGGHLSSIFNIITRQGNRKHITARGGISPITGNLVVEGPIKKDTSSFMISARSSYSDWILKSIKDKDFSNSSAAFNDLSGGVNFDIRKSQLSVFAYHSSDRFRLSDLASYTYANNGASASLSHNYSNSLRGEFSLIGSQYNFSTIASQNLSNAYEHAYKMEHYEARADFKQLLNDKNTLDYGVGAILYKLDRGKVQPYGPGSLHKNVDLGTEKGIESAVYLTEICQVLPWINLTTGIRYALYTPIGPKTVYLYEPGKAKDIRTIVDSISFNANQPIRWYHEPDLRVAVNIKTDESGSVKLSFNQMHQNLFMLNTTFAIAPNSQWKLADYNLLPSKSNQLSAGVYRTLADYGIETSAEIYYKQTRNFPEFRDGADFLNNPLIETAVLQGNQLAWGIELYVKRSMRKLEGWISYTYSRSKIKVDGGQEWNQINNGETYPANFDIPHSLNMVLNFHFSRRITLSSIVTYQSGKPVTYPISVYYVNGIPMLDYSKRNEYRIPYYLRSDVSLTVEGNLKKNKLQHSSFVFSLYNALGRDNAYSVYYKTENAIIRSYKYSVFAVPVFTATWLFKLGNYASE